MYKRIHPAVTVTAGFFLVLLLQLIDYPGLLVLGLFLLVLAWGVAMPVWVKITRRLKYVLIVLAALFAWQTPGTLVFPVMGEFSPSVEGLRLGFEQILRLVGAASLISILLHILDAPAWMNSLHVLLHPLRLLGLDADRFVLRLRLVMDQALDHATDWQGLLSSADADTSVNPIVWHVRELSWLDRCLLAVIALLLLGVCAWQG